MRLASTAERDDPAIGQIVAGRFRVERLIGEGAAGRVYAATQLSLGHEVAVKLLHPHHLLDPRHVRRFYREARAATRLTSQHVVRVLDFGVDDASRSPFIVMELLRGETLEAWLARVGPVRPVVAARALAQVTRALIDATQAGIVHRDLKPANIMRIETGDGAELIKVTDFGVAKDLLASDTATLTAHGASVGTPAYMAPEQVTGGSVDHRTDLYALGCILFEMLAGRRPFDVPARAEILLGHLLVAPPSLPAPLPTGETAPPALTQLLARLLAKEPADRPSDARAVAAVLDAVAAERPAPNLAPPQRSPTGTATAHGGALAVRPEARASAGGALVAASAPRAVSERVERRAGVLGAVWSWLWRRPLSADEKLRKAARIKRRRWLRHKRTFISVGGGLVAINVITMILSAEFIPWSAIPLAFWGTFLTMHWFGYRGWRDEHREELMAAGIEPDPDSPGALRLPMPSRVSPWPSLVRRCRKAVASAERALAEVDAAAGGTAEPRLGLRDGLADIERLALGAERLEAVLNELSPGLAELHATIASLDMRIGAASEPRLRKAYEDNRALLQARARRVEQVEAELMRMSATAEGFVLAAENIRLDAARIGAPRLYEYALSLQEPLRRLDDEVELMREVESELDQLPRS